MRLKDKLLGKSEMTATGSSPKESMPAIETVENPAVHYDGTDLNLFYKIAPRDGGGVAAIKFSCVIDFRINPINSEYLDDSFYPVRLREFTEIRGADKNHYWEALNPRFWTIAFNDQMIEIVFSSVELLFTTKKFSGPNQALIAFLEP